MKLFPTLLLTSLVAAGCLPSRLQKYRSKDSDPRVSEGGPAASVPPPAPESSYAAKGKTPPPPQSRQAQSTAPTRATIYAVDKQTFRFALREQDIWDTAIAVLLKNYILTIADRSTGIITTEWDSYYLENAVFRNRLSLRVARNSWNTVDVTVKNTVERLRDASQATGAVGAVWLPAEDGANEPGRIVQNMALLMNQPPPVLPPGSAVAKGSAHENKTLK